MSGLLGSGISACIYGMVGVGGGDKGSRSLETHIVQLVLFVDSYIVFVNMAQCPCMVLCTAGLLLGCSPFRIFCCSSGTGITVMYSKEKHTSQKLYASKHYISNTVEASFLCSIVTTKAPG